MSQHPEKIPILLLAAGSSSRMGQSKQLLLIHGKPLLQQTAEELVAANTGDVIVVLGAQAEAHKKVIASTVLHIIENDQWQNGMGSSIKLGLQFIEDQIPEAQAVIISVCDQPHLNKSHIQEIATTYLNSKSPIIASAYNKTAGVPVLFDRSHFMALSQIEDKEGAKKVIQQNINLVKTVSFPLGVIDLDTKEDYDTFSQ
ncbi:MAG: nucleotidyltransferase family protein [Cyclobacteriaceae bacterium]